MIDLTSHIRAAHGRSPLWSSATVRSLSEAVAEALDAEVDWDFEAGEAWARFIKRDQVVGIVAITAPIAIFVQEVDDMVRPLLTQADVELVAVQDMRASVITCEVEALALVFGDRVASPALNSGCFSAEDLWFATI